jgi:hypothetical protein
VLAAKDREPTGDREAGQDGHVKTTEGGAKSQAKEQNMTQKTVAEILVETLIAAGVTRIYGVVGDSLNGILEEIRRSKKIDWIGVRLSVIGL